MATKLEEKKASIGYIVSDPPSCGSCENFSSRKETRKGMYGIWAVEKGLRCELHGFATKKMAYCNDFKRKGTK
jgi:hypothetical protein